MGAVFSSAPAQPAAPPPPPPQPVAPTPAGAPQSMVKIAGSGGAANRSTGALSTATQGTAQINKGLTKQIDAAPATLLG